MRYARVFAPTALLGIAATGVVVACSGSGSNADGQGQVVQAANPPGNNGTVKIQEAGSTTEVPDNDPHVGCAFVIEFRGYDEGDLTATWSLTAQPPSGDTELLSGSVFIGGDPAGGADDLDGTANVAITDAMLAGLTESPQQGFHLKLEVQAEGSQGAPTKFKVFWVQGCGADAGPPLTDAGADADAGPPLTDAGADADAEPPPTDGGAPVTDAGPKMW